MRKITKEHKEDLKRLENGETIAPRLTSRKSMSSKKRKHRDRKSSGSSKKRRTKRASEDEDEASDISEFDSSQSSSSSSNSESEDSEDESHTSSSEEEKESPTESEPEDEQVTEDSLKAKIKDCKKAIKELRIEFTEARGLQKESSDKLATLKKSLANVQREKNAFCSLERSKASMLNSPN